MSGMTFASYGLLCAAGVQYWRFRGLFPVMPDFILMVLIALPWTTVFILTAFRRLPFSYSKVRLCILLAFAASIAISAFLECAHLVTGLPKNEALSTNLGRLLLYGGLIWFAAFAFPVLKKNPQQ